MFKLLFILLFLLFPSVFSQNKDELKKFKTALFNWGTFLENWNDKTYRKKINRETQTDKKKTCPAINNEFFALGAKNTLGNIRISTIFASDCLEEHVFDKLEKLLLLEQERKIQIFSKTHNKKETLAYKNKLVKEGSLEWKTFKKKEKGFYKVRANNKYLVSQIITTPYMVLKYTIESTNFAPCRLIGKIDGWLDEYGEVHTEGPINLKINKDKDYHTIFYEILVKGKKETRQENFWDGRTGKKMYIEFGGGWDHRFYHN